jgi:hypothetical protein
MLTEEVSLPSAVNTLPVLDTPMISLVEGRAFVDGDPVDELGDATQTGTLPRVTALLRSRREHGSVLQPDKPFPGRVVLHIDRDAPAYQVKRLVASASAAGIHGIDFMVMQR